MNDSQATGAAPSGEVIRLAYLLFLGREPSAEEVADLVAWRLPLLGLRDAFLDSAEFSRLYGARRPLDPGPPTVIHLHIPKAAGTSLTSLLAADLAPEDCLSLAPEGLDALRSAPPEARDRLRLVFGHLEHGVHRHLDRPHLYVSTLRLPGPRLLSYFRYVGRTASHPLSRVLRERGMTFGDFLEFAAWEDPAQRLEADNGQMRRLAGRMTLGHLGRERDVFREAVGNCFAPDMIVGLTEAFGLHLEQLAAAGVVSSHRQVFENSAPEPASFEEERRALTARQLDLLHAFTYWDEELYRVCKLSILGVP